MGDILPKFNIMFENEQYEIHDFLDKHPGGKAIIEEYKDKDITEVFESIGHSKYAKKLLANYKVRKQVESIKQVCQNDNNR